MSLKMTRLISKITTQTLLRLPNYPYSSTDNFLTVLAEFSCYSDLI